MRFGALAAFLCAASAGAQGFEAMTRVPLSALLAAGAEPAAIAEAGPAAEGLSDDQRRVLERALARLAGSSSGKKIAEAARSVPVQASSGFTGYTDGTLYIAEEYLKAGASPDLAAVILTAAGADVAYPGIPPSTDEGVYFSHVMAYRVALELDIAPAAIGEVFGKSLRDWIRDPAKEKKSLLDGIYPSLEDPASWSDEDRAYLGRYDVAAARKALAEFETATETWRRKRAPELKAWAGRMDAWLSAKKRAKK